jgi:hypothetical protein
VAVSAFHLDGSYGLVLPTLVAGGSLFVPRREDVLFPGRVGGSVKLNATAPTPCSRLVMRRSTATVW